MCDLWLRLRIAAKERQGWLAGEAGRGQRDEALAELARTLPYAYVPRFYEPEYRDGRIAALNRLRSDVPATIEPCVIRDLEGIPLPTRPVVPFVECVHDRIAIEIMRGCPWQCRFCQSTVIKRPLRIRSSAYSRLPAPPRRPSLAAPSRQSPLATRKPLRRQRAPSSLGSWLASEGELPRSLLRWTPRTSR